DSLVGNAGNDQINGGAGRDHMWGGTGRDVLISIDGGTWDYVEGNEDRDVFWKDYSDSVIWPESQDAFQTVTSFANGADRTLNGDRILDPTVKSGHTYRRFFNNPLFGSGGPRLADINQGNLGDCYFMAALGAVANDNRFAIQSRVVDFNDGTYGVRFGNKFYRVDDDLPVFNSMSNSPAYAGLGASDSIWVAIMEKAYAHYRTGANSYASIENGWSKEVNAALGSTSSGGKSIGSYSSASAMATDIWSRWNSYQAVTVGFTGLGVGVPLVDDHMYTVVSVQRNSSGVVTSITLRNPWGTDGAEVDANPNDGLVVVTPAQIFSCIGQVNWGRV
ncbi:MAG: C2 family cysteine protease, partial [Gemmataceae bacterium]